MKKKEEMKAKLKEFREQPLEQRQALLKRSLKLINEKDFKRILGGKS